MAGDGNSFAKLNDENYADWKMMMEALLVRKQLWDIVSGEKTKPLGSVTSAPVKAFIRKQAEARAELVLQVETSQLPHLRNEDPVKIWEDLKNIHQARGLASRISLRRKFLWLSKATDQTMSSWVAKVRHTAFRLEEIGVEVSDEDFILVLTQGLPPSYDNFVVTLDATDVDVLSSEHVITRLLNEEARQINGTRESPKTDAAYFVANQRRTPIAEITCFKCGKKGHYQSQCPDAQKEGVSANGAFVEDSDAEDGVW
jgi:hypothetical protein